MHDSRLVAVTSMTVIFNLFGFTSAIAADEAAVIDSTQQMIPVPPWSQGDQIGMANTIGPGTWARCGYHLSKPGAKVYEISHVRSQTMPIW